MRLQISVRWLLALVVVAALSFWLVVWLGARRERFLRLAAYHQDRMSVWTRGRPIYAREGGALLLMRNPTGNNPGWHGAMAMRYRHAARYPWLPLPPAPAPEPFILERCIVWRMQAYGETREQAREMCCRPPRPRTAQPSLPPRDAPPD